MLFEMTVVINIPSSEFSPTIYCTYTNTYWVVHSTEALIRMFLYDKTRIGGDSWKNRLLYFQPYWPQRIRSNCCFPGKKIQPETN